MDITNKVFLGNTLELLKDFPDNSIDLVVTSPPYYKLRDYEHPDQIGQEDDMIDYIRNLMMVFLECKRILKDTGSIYVNIADKYDKYNSLMGIPEEFMRMMTRSLGFFRPNTIIWQKNALPESPKARYSNNFEYFYFFTKSIDYTFNIQYEPYAESTLKQVEQIYKGQAKKDYSSGKVQNPSDTKRRIISSIKFGGKKYPDNVDNGTYSGKQWVIEPEKGARKRCVWKIATANNTENHYASYPEKLVETPIRASSNVGDLVLDPFCGSGTTLFVANRLGRKYCGIDIQQKYINSINRKLRGMLDVYIK